MPRLSLYRPEKGNDFRMLDRVINEQFQVGGTDIVVHKYIGTEDPLDGESTPTTPVNGNPIPELGIQDVLFMENRDRKYEKDVYVFRGIYTMQDIDFNLSQFGFFLSNDNIMITFHLRGCVELMGRKLMSGDVLELPHLKDEYALSDDMVALKRFYVVTDVTRPASGYSQTWYPHLLRAKCEPLVDSQEFKQILDQDAGDGENTLRDVMSQYRKNIEINNQIIAQAEEDAGLSGYDTDQYYILPLKDDGQTLDVADVTSLDADASQDTHEIDASSVFVNPDKDVYISYLQGDGKPPNGAPYTFGIEFPYGPARGAFHLRTDYLPNRLFRFSGQSWVYVESNVRMNMTNEPADGALAPAADTKQTQVGSFINNSNTATIAGSVVEERQSLSKALKKQRPQADN
jgi:hypothetical protein